MMFTNRRALLGVTAAAPVLLAAASVAAIPLGPSYAAWTSVTHRFDRAAAALAVADSDDDEEGGAFTLACSEHARAIDALIVCPAPDRDAFAFKLDLLAKEFSSFTVEAELLAAIAADGHRLLRGEG